MNRKSIVDIIKILKIIIVVFTVSLLTFSCASIGSNTLYIVKDLTIKRPSKILLVQPTLVNCIGEQDESYNLLERLLNSELIPFNITVEKSNIGYQDFDTIGEGSTFTADSIPNVDYLMFTKITRLTAMGQTRDYKVEYKLVSKLDNKLKFHSEYNTTVGATVVVIPGISDYPNDEKMMTIAIRSGLHEFKKKVLIK